jgi:hypothetical protein
MTSANLPICQSAARLLELLEDEGVSPAFIAAFERADSRARELFLKWLALALNLSKRAKRNDSHG